MTDIIIPPEAVRAAKIAWANNGGPTSDDDMAASIAAAINAWPGARAARNGSSVSLSPHIILPLPQEARDE